MKIEDTFSYISLFIFLVDEILGGCTRREGECTGLLGAGTGLGSCAAPPFRATQVQFKLGCPREKPCCSEYGYCRTRQDWDFGFFRDCNGVSNGRPLDGNTVDREARASPFVGIPSGFLGPKFKLRERFHVESTDKLRPTLPPTHESLIKQDETEFEDYKLKDLDQLKTLIYLINKNYGVGAANNVNVKLKLKAKLPSENFKTKKDFLEQLKILLLKEPKTEASLL